MDTTTMEQRYTERDLVLGVPQVEEVMAFTDTQKEQRTTEVTASLAACALEDVLDEAQRMERLYGRSSTRNARFDINHVDVYARGIVQALKPYAIGELLGGVMLGSMGVDTSASKAISELEHTRRVVAAQKHRTNLQPLIK